MKFKSLVTFSFFFVFSLAGIFFIFSGAEAGTNTGDCNCFAPVPSGEACASDGCWTASGTCSSDAACTTSCKSEAPTFSADPNETTGDCWGFEPTPLPAEIKCDTINQKCFGTTGLDGEFGQSLHRFFSPTVSGADCYCCGNCGFNDIIGIFINAADYLFGILGALALLFFIYGGLVWLTSGGSAGQIDKGKKILLGAVIGMLLALGAWLIVKFLITALGVTTSVRGF